MRDMVFVNRSNFSITFFPTGLGPIHHSSWKTSGVYSPRDLFFIDSEKLGSPRRPVDIRVVDSPG